MDGEGQGAAATLLVTACAVAATPREAPPAAAPPSPPVRRRQRSWTRAILLGLAAALILAIPILLAGREVAAPSWLRERVEREAGALLDGGTMTFGAMTLAVGLDLRPRVRVLDAELRDGGGRMLARIPELAASISPRGLLSRRVLVRTIEVHGATASVARARDGSVSLMAAADGTIGAAQAVEASLGQGLASLPDRFEGLFEGPALRALRHVSVEGLVVSYDDARAGRSWTLDGGTLQLDLSGGEAHLTGEVAVLSGRTTVTRARLDYRSPLGGPEAEIGLTLTDVAAADVASQSAALAWLGVVDAPVSLALRVSLDEEGRLGPMRAALKIAEGRIRPRGGAPPVSFDVGRAYLTFDPEARRIDFSRIEVRSGWGSALAEGRAWLDPADDGLPGSIVGQFRLREASLDPPGVLDEPMRLTDASAELRLSLDPFEVEVVQASALDAGGAGVPGLGRILATGRIGASREGWSVAVDASLAEASHERLLELWPSGLRPGLRDWIARNLTAGRLSDATVAVRAGPDGPRRIAATARFDDLAVRPLASQPPIRGGSGRLAWEAGHLSMALETGWVDADEGGALDLAGTALVIAPGTAARAPARVAVAVQGSITAALSLLDRPPLALLSNAGLPADLAEGQASATGTVDLFIGPMRPDELRYDVRATLEDASTGVLVPGWTLVGDGLEVAATEEGLAIEGPAQLGGIRGTGRWSQVRAEPGRSRVEADVEVTPASLAALGVGLPEGAVTGEGRGTVTLDLRAGEAPRFLFASTLEGLGLRLPEMGWSKEPSASGELEVSGRLGAPVAVDRLALAAPGLDVEGTVALSADGSLDRLDLERLRVGDWFDAPVTLRGRGPGATPGVEVGGGVVDLRTAAFGEGGAGEGGPVSIRLERLQVTEGIALTGLSADLSTAGGLEGTFRAQVNGGPEVTGRVAPQGGRVGARIQGVDAGAVMRAADLFTRAEGGTLDLLLLPVGVASYDGEAFITGLRVRDAPVLASLLNAVSVVGLLQQLGGQGLVFDQVSADFRIDPERVVVSRASAVGASLGLTLDGAFDSANAVMDFEGVLSPIYLINGIGRIFTRPGEGLIGFNYSLRGSPDAPEVGVNPLSALTPGAFRGIFRQGPAGG